MDRSRTYRFLACLALLLPACREVSVPRQDGASSPVYEDSVYCFNGRSIVTLDGRKGIVDMQGRGVLAPEWDSVEFLDDEIALLSKSGVWSLCTRDGRIFAQAADSLSLERACRELYEAMADGDRRYWDQVLDCLEVLEEACLTADSGRLDDRIVHAHAALQKQLDACPGGGMTASQRERLERIEADFSSMYRR